MKKSNARTCEHELTVVDATLRFRSGRQRAAVERLRSEKRVKRIFVCVHCDHAEAEKFPGQDDKMVREGNLKTK